MYKTHDETTKRILSMAAEQDDEQERVSHNGDREKVDSEVSVDKRESHITVVPFNPVQVGSFQ